MANKHAAMCRRGRPKTLKSNEAEKLDSRVSHRCDLQTVRGKTNVQRLSVPSTTAVEIVWFNLLLTLIWVIDDGDVEADPENTMAQAERPPT